MFVEKETLKNNKLIFALLDGGKLIVNRELSFKYVQEFSRGTLGGG